MSVQWPQVSAEWVLAKALLLSHQALPVLAVDALLSPLRLGLELQYW